jgi:hypothetical protein
MTTFPSLYARVEPDGGVKCTATLGALGRVWWTCDAANVITWHYVSLRFGTKGDRTTQRAAVQALRDAANATMRLPLGPADDDDSTTTSAPAAAAPAAATPRPVVLAPSQRIAWGTASDVGDLTNAIQRAFDRHKDGK